MDLRAGIVAMRFKKNAPWFITVSYTHLKGDFPKEIEIKDFEALVGQLARARDIRPTQILQEFTLLRSRTAIDKELGSALPQSLRTMRVLKKGIVMGCRVDIHTTRLEGNPWEQLLTNCVKGLRSMGLGRTRGLGEVRCYLRDISVSPKTRASKSFSLSFASSAEEEITMPYQIHLDSPVILPGAGGLYHTCENWIPGRDVYKRQIQYRLLRCILKIGNTHRGSLILLKMKS